jgi:hypothetical protein
MVIFENMKKPHQCEPLKSNKEGGFTKEDNPAVNPATQKQFMKYAEDMVKLYHELKKEKELLSKFNRKKVEVCIDGIKKKYFYYPFNGYNYYVLSDNLRTR